jgi:hypothetical protein
MTDRDFETFSSEVRRVAVVMRLRAAPIEVHQITKAYFTALRRYPIGAVTLGADRWIESGSRFPKAKEWIDAIPPPEAATVLELTRDEADEWLAAERRGWEQSPCACVLCVAANVDKPLRFVPDVEPDGRDARGRIGDRTIVRGHWAHGEELARWYGARGDSYNEILTQLPRTFPTTPLVKPRERIAPILRGRVVSFQERLNQIFAPRSKPREPGQEG